ncbi:hypothetical protein BJY52DRAFT_1416015 [Lactarius psammicola]|nr:hypothetical protein BJY52DRAFT_1416015 [Lactarius psammicola]
MIRKSDDSKQIQYTSGPVNTLLSQVTSPSQVAYQWLFRRVLFVVADSAAALYPTGPLQGALGHFVTIPDAANLDKMFNSCAPPRAPPLYTYAEPCRVLHLPVEIVLAILEAGYYTDDLHQDTRFLLSTALISKGWSLAAQMLLFRHVSVHSHVAFNVLFKAISSHVTRGKRLARHVRSLSAVLDPQQPGRLHALSFAHAVSLFPNLSKLDLTFYPPPKLCPLNERESEPFFALENEALSILRSGPRITTLRLANWSSDTSLFGKLLSLYRRTLRTISLRGTPASYSASSASSPLPTPLCPLNLTLEPSLTLASALVGWLTDPSTAPLVRALEFVRQPEPVVLATLLAAHGTTLTALALPTLTTADVAVIAAHGCSRLEALRTEHPYAALPRPTLRARLRHAALAAAPALALAHEEARMRGRLESMSVVLWRRDKEERAAVRALKVLCAQLGIRAEFELDVIAFRARFWAGAIQPLV